MLQVSVRKKLIMAGGPGSLTVDTQINTGEFVAVFGRSGAGKTSLLRMIAGLLKPEKGLLMWDDEVWLDTEKKFNLSVQKRRIGFVFQEPSLFPNMTVRGNLQYAAKKNTDDDFITRLLQMVNMERLADRMPQTLSGGQQQRIAMIRALAGKPRLLLLDEPFSALDMEMRRPLLEELIKLHRHFGLTTLFVTHELADIFHFADKALILDQGAVVKSGNPHEVFGKGVMDSKIQLQGEILQIRKSGVVYIAEILTGNSITNLVVSEQELTSLKPGVKVLISSGSFDPVIKALT